MNKSLAQPYSLSYNQILESGTHDALLAAKGHYHALYTRQFRQEREASLFEVAG